MQDDGEGGFGGAAGTDGGRDQVGVGQDEPGGAAVVGRFFLMMIDDARTPVVAHVEVEPVRRRPAGGHLLAVADEREANRRARD